MGASRTTTSSWVDAAVRDARPLDIFPPPTYEESLADLPPDYSATDDGAVVQTLLGSKLDLLPSARRSRKQPSGHGLFDVKIDWSEIEGVRMHAKKKKKAATNWESDNEEEKKKKEEEANAGGGDGGAGGGDDAGGGTGGDGGGGDPPGGGDDGGDDGDDWGAAGGGKKKKKKKKNAW